MRDAWKQFASETHRHAHQTGVAGMNKRWRTDQQRGIAGDSDDWLGRGDSQTFLGEVLHEITMLWQPNWNTRA